MVCDMDAFSFFARVEDKDDTGRTPARPYRGPPMFSSGVGKCGRRCPGPACACADEVEVGGKTGNEAAAAADAADCGQRTTEAGMMAEPRPTLQELIPPPTVRRSRQLLGRGRQGAVWLGEDTKRPGVYYAVKTVEMPLSTFVPPHQIIQMLSHAPDSRVNLPYAAPPHNIVMEPAYEEEARLLRGLRHPGLVQLHWVETDVESEGIAVCRFYLEYMSCGSLLSFVRQHYEAGRLRERALRWFLKPIVKGMCYMHANDVVHLDVKAENILVKWADEHDDDYRDYVNSPRRFPVTKLGDFGCARHVGSRKAPTDSSTSGSGGACSTRDVGQQFGEVPSGTPGFIAPEIILQPHTKSDGCSTAADVWSLGCTILQLLYGALPVHSDLNVAAILFETAMHPKKIHRFIPPVGPESDTCGAGTSMSLTNSPGGVVISATLRHLLLRCLEPDPTKRATAAQLLRHPFFQQPCSPADAAEGLLDPRLFDAHHGPCGLQNDSFMGGTSGSLISTHFDGLSISDGDGDDDTDDDMMMTMRDR